MYRLSRKFLLLSLVLLTPLTPVRAEMYSVIVTRGNAHAALGPITVLVDNVSPANHVYSFNDYFPHLTNVHQGDVVTFKWAANPNALHTVTFIPAGVSIANRYSSFPGAGLPIPDLDDAPGTLYFPFNLFQPQRCGNSSYFPRTAPCPFTGHSVLNSGLLLPAQDPRTHRLISGIPTPTFSVRFNVSPGMYYYFDLLHVAMVGVVRVLPTGAALPTQQMTRRTVQQQYRKTVSRVEAYERSIHVQVKRQGNHNLWVAHAGLFYDRVEVAEFLPQHLYIRAGDTVLWRAGGSQTVTFPAPSPVSGLIAKCETPTGDRPFTGVFAGCNFEEEANRGGTLPSGWTGHPYTGGFYNSGNLSVPKPHPWTVVFPLSGSFRYMSLIHFNMYGTVTVR